MTDQQGKYVNIVLERVYEYKDSPNKIGEHCNYISRVKFKRSVVGGEFLS